MRFTADVAVKRHREHVLDRFPALLSIGVLDALFCRNDVLLSLLVMPSAEHRTLVVGVTASRGQYSDDIPCSPPAC